MSWAVQFRRKRKCFLLVVRFNFLACSPSGPDCLRSVRRNPNCFSFRVKGQAHILGGDEGMYIGRALKRGEDLRFLTGRGKYTDDIVLPNTASIAFLRSPHAHARIKQISTDRAKRLPGVLAVITELDWRAAKLGALPCLHPVPSQDGRPMNEARRPVFCGKK